MKELDNTERSLRIITHSNWIGDFSWNLRLLRLISSSGVLFSFKLNHSVWGKWWYLCECCSYKANYLHWQLMILCLLRTDLSHLTHSPPIAPPHSFHYLSSLRALGLSLAIACAETAEYNHSIFSSSFFFFLPWVNTPIPCMDGDHYRSDSARGNVSRWIVSPESHRWTRDKSLSLSSVPV